MHHVSMRGKIQFAAMFGSRVRSRVRPDYALAIDRVSLPSCVVGG